MPLPYGGAISFIYTTNLSNNSDNLQVQTFYLDTMVNGDVLYTASNRQGYCGVFSNNTVWFMQDDHYGFGITKLTTIDVNK
ncbi:5894_t:CDS:1, partial [Racocetra fulgida]